MNRGFLGLLDFQATQVSNPLLWAHEKMRAKALSFYGLVKNRI